MEMEYIYYLHIHLIHPNPANPNSNYLGHFPDFYFSCKFNEQTMLASVPSMISKRAVSLTVRDDKKWYNHVAQFCWSC